MLLEAIRTVVGETASQRTDVSANAQLFRIAEQQKLLPVVVDALYAWHAAEDLEDYPTYKRTARAQVMEQARRGLEFLEVYDKLKEAGVFPLVVKGCVCRTAWRKGDLRISGDEDIYVRPEDFTKACQLLQDCGLTKKEDADPIADFEIGWRRPNSTLYIELHQKLFAPDAGALGSLQQFFDDAFDRAREYEVERGAAKVWSMSPEDHLLYLILHAYKHFIRSGFGIRQVCDVGLWMKAYGNEIDHEQIISKLALARAQYFAAAILAIAKEDLGIDLQLPPCWDALSVDRKPMLDDLLDAGIYGSSSMSRQHSAPMLKEAVAASRENRKRSGVLRHAFPPREKLLREYPVLQKHPAALPAVWLKRLLKYRKETKDDENNSAMESIRIAKEREALLRCYRII